MIYLLFFYYCDYFYKGSGNRYALHGGPTDNGLYCGALYVGLVTFTSTGWYRGACLSFKLYFYCDYLYQSSGVKYPSHGGASEHGVYCGAFFVAASVANTYVYWRHGACLSFKLIEYFFIVIIFIN